MEWVNEFWKNLFKNPFWMFGNSVNNVNSAISDTNNAARVDSVLAGADKDPTAAQGDLARGGYSLTPEQEKWLDNLIAQQNTATNNAFQEHMRDTSYTSAGEQLTALGLSPSGVLQTGGASSGVTSAPADNSKSNIAMERYSKKMALAKQLISMTSSMAAAGIGGGSLLQAKKASAILASQTSQAARMVTNYDKNDRRIGRTISEVIPQDFDYSSLF